MDWVRASTSAAKRVSRLFEFFKIAGVPCLEGLLEQSPARAQGGLDACDASIAQLDALGAPVEWIRCPLDQTCTLQLGDVPGNGGGIQVCADGQVGDTQRSGCSQGFQ